mgnify:CR=1 FL=1
MEIKPIRNEADYKNALERLEVIFDAPVDTKEGDEADDFETESGHQGYRWF